MESHQVDGTLEPEDIIRRQREFVAERRKEGRVNSILDFETNRGTAAEVSQFRLDFHEEIRGFFLVDVEFAVAGDPKRVRGGQAVTGEQFSGAEFDDFAEKDDALRTAATGSDAHEAW